MIIYNKTLKEFTSDVELNVLSDELLNTCKSKGIYPSINEINSWQNSLGFMKNVLVDPDFDEAAKVAIEYQIPRTAKRIDFILNGTNSSGKENIVIVELKQWSKVEKVDDESKHTVKTYTGNKNQLVAHPSYQAYSYSLFIKDNSLNEGLLNSIGIFPCAYLHNYIAENESIIKDPIYKLWLDEAPLFIKSEVINFRNFLKNHVKSAPKNPNTMLLLEQNQFKPSKSLQNSLVSLIQGKKEFVLLDDQIVTFDLCLSTLKKSLEDKKKRTIIVEGGPGTGKTVLAMNLLQEMLLIDANVSYATKNSAPRNAFLHLLTNSQPKQKARITNLFRSPFGLSKLENNSYDCLLVDEAHRLVKKMYGDWNGENQIKECIQKSLLNIFFIDESQRITTKDIGKINTIKKYATEFGSEVVYFEDTKLKSQFRCNGSDRYIQFINGALQTSDELIKTNLKDLNFEFKLFDNPNEMRNALRKLNSLNGNSRMVAGYCYDWNVKNGRGEYDIFLEDNFKAKWNLDGNKIWAVNTNSFEEVGCIHTAQGLEFDYVGVFIGKDLRFDEKKGIITDKTKISLDDNSSGIRTTDDLEAKELIKNTYKTLLTRGQKGCYVYCEDKELYKYLNSLVSQN